MRANYLSAGGSCVQIKSEIALNAARDALGCSCNAIALECHRRLQESKSVMADNRKIIFENQFDIDDVVTILFKLLDG